MGSTQPRKEVPPSLSPDIPRPTTVKKVILNAALNEEYSLDKHIEDGRINWYDKEVVREMLNVEIPIINMNDYFLRLHYHELLRMPDDAYWSPHSLFAFDEVSALIQNGQFQWNQHNMTEAVHFLCNGKVTTNRNAVRIRDIVVPPFWRWSENILYLCVHVMVNQPMRRQLLWILSNASVAALNFHSRREPASFTRLPDKYDQLIAIVARSESQWKKLSDSKTKLRLLNIIQVDHSVVGSTKQFKLAVEHSGKWSPSYNDRHKKDTAKHRSRKERNRTRKTI